MRIALLSDTHDNEATTRAALALLRPYRPEAYLHAGDLVSPGMLRLFDGLPLHFVFGNNEYDLGAIRSVAAEKALTCHDVFGDLTLGGKRIALLHGHDTRGLRNAVQSGQYAYVVHGHTHVTRDERAAGGTRIINPGALQRAKVKTVALLDLTTDTLEFIEVPG